MTRAIEARGITQGYGTKKVLENVDLVLDKGIFGLLGPNGAGKTTLLRTLATVVPPVRGDLTICGHRLDRALNIRLARRQIGYLPQHFGFFPNFTVYEFVRYCAWLREVDRKTIHKATIEAIERVALSAQSKTKLRKLSGGMLRRCGVAQAIVGNPGLILLDEPTVGLDPAQRLEFRDLLRSFSDTTVVLSTHLVEDVSATCDEAIVMDDGEFRFRGTPTELENAAHRGARGDTALERGYTSVLEMMKVPS
ncbi:ATP-binding cassette domain-containing protein [Micromonospora sp. B006]|uniref:ATP-binding cassette domain-containing protein n=1 Tax=Micromonospora sp. B006 TaxID=2201999 RepID=UPI000E3058A5|nr:ATP-binding cassette domain-containing protein [Micromonospora sp. B006]AXO33254.1 multidrug ABC transporter ATPase [Micromonospora sp. B006]